MDVDIFGMKLDLPDEQAKALIAERDKRTQQYNEVTSRATDLETARAAAEAERQAAAARAEEETARAKAIELAKSGEIEQALKQNSEQIANKYLGEIAKRDEALKARTIDALINGRADVVAESRADVAALVGNMFTVEDGNVVPVVDGKPNKEAKPEDVLGSWLESRPHFRKGNVPAGTHGSPTQRNSEGVQTITRTEYDPTDKAQGALIAAGKLKIINE